MDSNKLSDLHVTDVTLNNSFLECFEPVTNRPNKSFCSNEFSADIKESNQSETKQMEKLVLNQQQNMNEKNAMKDYYEEEETSTSNKNTDHFRPSFSELPILNHDSPIDSAQNDSGNLVFSFYRSSSSSFVPEDADIISFHTPRYKFLEKNSSVSDFGDPTCDTLDKSTFPEKSYSKAMLNNGAGFEPQSENTLKNKSEAVRGNDVLFSPEPDSRPFAQGFDEYCKKSSSDNSKDRETKRRATHEDCYKLLEMVNDLASGLSPLEPAPCELERSSSWEFSSSNLKRSGFHNSYHCISSSNSLSSLESFLGFNEALRSLVHLSRSRYFNFADELLRRSFVYQKKRGVLRKCRSSNALNRLENDFNADESNNNNSNKNYANDNNSKSSDSSRTESANCSLTIINHSGISDSESVIADLERVMRDLEAFGTDGSHFVQLTADKKENRNLPQSRTPGILDSTLVADVPITDDWLIEEQNRGEKLRKLYNTCDSSSAACLQESPVRQLSNSSVMVPETSDVAFNLAIGNVEESRVQNDRSESNRESDMLPHMISDVRRELLNADSDESLSDESLSDVQNYSNWTRASMRLIRPFRLFDPPASTSLPGSYDSQSNQIPAPATVQQAPIFPCVVTERLTEVTSVEEPRQYGRAAERQSQVRQLSESRTEATSSSTSQRVRSTSATPSVNISTPSAQQTLNVSSPQPFGIFRAYEMIRDSESPLGQWSHGLSSTFACLGCTLGIFNISRFAIFSVHFGANFILQFLILTALIGVPLFSFHMSLGQLLGTGCLDMWYISPIFKGVGIALLMSQAFIGIYSIIGVSWMLVYFRDSFISRYDTYRWAEPLELYGEDGIRSLRYSNGSFKVEQTVPDYLSGVVLQRRGILKPEDDLVNIKFSVAFNLAIVWIIVFLCLCKGIKSYGKVVYIFSVLPVFGMFLLCAKLIGFLPSGVKARNVLPEVDWNEFFLNSKSWVMAFTEVFLTWGVFGASAMQITSHNKQKHLLHRDVSLLVIVTICVLLLSSFLANMCSQLLDLRGYIYLPSSFEQPSMYVFLHKRETPLPYNYANMNTPIRWMSHSGLLLGERTIRPGSNIYEESGYQVLRLATELVPSTLAVVGLDVVSPFWSFLFYLILILFGISQQLAVWYTVISGLVSIKVKSLKPCWTTIAWFACVIGYVLGLPMTTEMGIFVVYFLDYVIGCGWWIMILYLLELAAIFIVRGRPYSGETIAVTLFTQSGYFLQNWIAPMFSFNWNVILPITLLLLSTSVFKNGGYKMLYNFRTLKYYEYWPLWSLKLGCLIQTFPLFLVPLVCIVQSYRYLSSGPPDLFDRIQLLYRPDVGNSQNRGANNGDIEANRNNNTNGAAVVAEDPPPKYTPPPSYSTATGARIAKLLRQSFRRSVRRIAHVLGAASNSVPEAELEHQLPPPPDYSTVLVEINQSLQEPVNAPIYSFISDSINNNSPGNSTLTPEHVASILRSNSRSGSTHRNLVDQECTSIQCLVESVAPINQDSIVLSDPSKDDEAEV